MVFFCEVIIKKKKNITIFIFQVYLERICLRLNEDRPPNNITSPGPIPIQLNITKLRIARDISGAFTIEPVGKLKQHKIMCRLSFYCHLQSTAFYFHIVPILILFHI